MIQARARRVLLPTLLAASAVHAEPPDFSGKWAVVPPERAGRVVKRLARQEFQHGAGNGGSEAIKPARAGPWDYPARLHRPIQGQARNCRYIPFGAQIQLGLGNANNLFTLGGCIGSAAGSR